MKFKPCAAHYFMRGSRIEDYEELKVRRGARLKRLFFKITGEDVERVWWCNACQSFFEGEEKRLKLPLCGGGPSYDRMLRVMRKMDDKDWYIWIKRWVAEEEPDDYVERIYEEKYYSYDHDLEPCPSMGDNEWDFKKYAFVDWSGTKKRTIVRVWVVKGVVILVHRFLRLRYVRGCSVV